MVKAGKILEGTKRLVSLIKVFSKREGLKVHTSYLLHAEVIFMETVDLLRSLMRALDKNIGALEKTQLACCGATIGQCHAVMEIGLAGQISLIDLANVLNLDKSTMSRTVNNLVTDEWIERITDPENRRYVKLMLSRKGQVLHEQISSALNAYFGNIMIDIPENKREQVAESLKLLIHALNKNSCC